METRKVKKEMGGARLVDFLPSVKRGEIEPFSLTALQHEAL